MQHKCGKASLHCNMHQDDSDVAVIEDGLIAEGAANKYVHFEDWVIDKLSWQDAAGSKCEEKNLLIFDVVFRDTESNETSKEENKEDAWHQDNDCVNQVMDHCHLLESSRVVIETQSAGHGK